MGSPNTFIPSEPSSLRGSTLGTRAAEYKGCNWGMQVDWWLQLCAVFSATVSVVSAGICHRNKVNSIAWLYREAQPKDSIIYITLHYITLPPELKLWKKALFGGSNNEFFYSSVFFTVFACLSQFRGNAPAPRDLHPLPYPHFAGEQFEKTMWQLEQC